MKLTGQFNFLGIENIQGKKDTTKVYHNLCLLQNNDVLKIFLSDESYQKITDIKPSKMDNLQCEIKISIGTKTYISLESVKKVA